tara:strand:+ start:4029 stop:5207 length:1179 start_codon:yes stop_codon:yes gene_type:complete
MKESFRWYGPDDPVGLSDIIQSGATNVVSALHQVPNGSVWEKDSIKAYKEIVVKAGLDWEVVESVPIHEDIKRRVGKYKQHIENYKKTIENLSKCGIYNICYNFMPVLDWTRTHLHYHMKDGSTALYLDKTALAAFDLFIVKRKNAEKQYNENKILEAKKYYDILTKEEVETLSMSIIAGLPGSEEKYSLEKFRNQLEYYESVSKSDLQKNLIYFLEEIIPTAEKFGVRMCIHPDDPPFDLFGIPRVVSTYEDLNFIFKAIPSLSNGLTFCTGSLGVRPDNNLIEIFHKFAERIHFLHLRSTKRDDKGNFYEANHLEGDLDMFQIVRAILIEEKKRKKVNRSDWKIPMRPDHGHQMLDDLNKKTNPGYSAIGRLRGLAEIRGLALGIDKTLF